MQINLSINIFFLISEENLYKDFQTDRLGQGLTHTHTQVEGPNKFETEKHITCSSFTCPSFTLVCLHWFNICLWPTDHEMLRNDIVQETVRLEGHM